MDQGRSFIEQLLSRLEALERRTAELETLLVEKDAIIAAQQQQIAAQQVALDRANDQLTLLKKAFFGPRRERYLPSPDQRLLFETLPTASETAQPGEPAANHSKPPRKKRSKFVIPDFLPVRREDHPLAPEALACGCCGAKRSVIRTHISRQLELEQAKAYVVEHVRYTYACSACRDGSQVVTTPKPLAPIDKSPFGASLLAWIVSAKFERHLPTYRHQEMLVAPLGLWLSRPHLAKLLSGTALCLKPLAAQLLVEILKSHILQADETPARYLGKLGGGSAQGYLFGYAGDAEHRFLYYDFRPTRNREGPRELLANYCGLLQSDGHSAYEALVKEHPDRLTPVGCWMHARRRFDEALVTTSHPLAAESLAAIQRLYDVDEQARSLPPGDRAALHIRQTRAIVDQLFARWDEARPGLRPTTKLFEAIRYALHRRADLTRFFDDGRIPLDTGHLERAIRPVAIGRKNFLFFGSFRGGQTAATLYSVVQSARLHQLDVTAYLTDVLRRLPAIDPNDVHGIRTLLPDQWAAANPGHILVSRDAELKQAADRRRQRRAQRRTAMSIR